MFRVKNLLNAVDKYGDRDLQNAFWRARLMDPDQRFFDEFSQPPPVLYKYVPVRRLDDALSDEKPCSFRATPPNQLNDINEMNYHHMFVDNEENREQINEKYANALTELHPASPVSVNDVEEYRELHSVGYGAELTCDQLSRRYGVTSFSATSNDIKMWSNYADECKGVVVGYSVNIWVSHLIGTSIIKQVRYSNELPLMAGPEVINMENVYALMSIKGAAWDYEKEWRLITELSKTDRSPNGIETITVPQESVSSIHITHRTSQDVVDTIARRLNSPSNDYRISRINKLRRGRDSSTLSYVGQIAT